MTQLLLHQNASTLSDRCALCGGEIGPPGEVSLVNAPDFKPVCSACARQYAPCLAALIGLAEVARRVGKIGRHTVFPPLTALLDLARAAEQYAATIEGGRMKEEG